MFLLLGMVTWGSDVRNAKFSEDSEGPVRTVEIRRQGPHGNSKQNQRDQEANHKYCAISPKINLNLTLSNISIHSKMHFYFLLICYILLI